MANLGPSEALISARRSNRITWAEFGRRYRKELKEDGSIDKRNLNIKNHGQKFTLEFTLPACLGWGRPTIPLSADGVRA